MVGRRLSKSSQFCFPGRRFSPTVHHTSLAATFKLRDFLVTLQKLCLSRLSPCCMLGELALQYVRFRDDCDGRRRHRYLDDEEGPFHSHFAFFGPSIASKGWHKRILYKCASMIDSPHTIWFSRPPDAWILKVQELRVALQAISVHECHDMCLLLEQELEITPERDYYRTMVDPRAKLANYPHSSFYDDSSDEDTVTTTTTTTTIASF